MRRRAFFCGPMTLPCQQEVSLFRIMIYTLIQRSKMVFTIAIMHFEKAL